MKAVQIKPFEIHTLISASLGTHRFQRAVSAGGALIGIKRAGIRIGSRRCGSSQYTTIHACTLEAMRTQASPDLCAESKWLIAFNFNSHRLRLITYTTTHVIPQKYVMRHGGS